MRERGEGGGGERGEGRERKRERESISKLLFNCLLISRLKCRLKCRVYSAWNCKLKSSLFHSASPVRFHFRCGN